VVAEKKRKQLYHYLRFFTFTHGSGHAHKLVTTPPPLPSLLFVLHFQPCYLFDISLDDLLVIYKEYGACMRCV
jgi:hypothetical protein